MIRLVKAERERIPHTTWDQLRNNVMQEREYHLF